MEIDSTIFRPANFIEAALGNIGLSLLLAFMFVAFVLGAFLFDWRAAVVSLVTISLSLAAAALVLSLRGASLNVDDPRRAGGGHRGWSLTTPRRGVTAVCIGFATPVRTTPSESVAQLVIEVDGRGSGSDRFTRQW